MKNHISRAKDLDLRTYLERNEGLVFNASGHALCPFHSEKTPSFHVNIQKNNYTCYGCEAHGDIIDFVQEYHDKSFNEALQHLLGEDIDIPETDSEKDKDRRKKEKELDQLEKAREEQEEAEYIHRCDKWKQQREHAYKVWNQGFTYASGLSGDRAILSYLNHRKLENMAAAAIRNCLPGALRFHSGLSYFDTEYQCVTGTYPALLAAITDNNQKLLGIQRIYVDPDTPGKAPVSAPKKILGATETEPMSGEHGSVKLGNWKDANEILICEGIETAIFLFLRYAMPVWASVSSGCMSRMQIPDKDILIFGENDDASRKAVTNLYKKHYNRWGRTKSNRKTRQIFPEKPYSDVLDEYVGKYYEVEKNKPGNDLSYCWWIDDLEPHKSATDRGSRPKYSQDQTSQQEQINANKEQKFTQPNPTS